MAVWSIVFADGTSPPDQTKPDNICPYPHGTDLALLDPIDGIVREVHTIGRIREIRINPLPTTGTFTYTLTRTDATTAVVRTNDERGLDLYGDNYLTISRVIAGTTSRYPLLVIARSQVRSIVRAP